MKINDKIQTQHTDDKTKWETSHKLSDDTTSCWEKIFYHWGRAEPSSQTQLEQIYDEDCGAGKLERRREGGKERYTDLFNWYNKEREGSECDSVENDEALGVRSRVTAIQARVSRENWPVEHVATQCQISRREETGPGRIKQKMSLLPAQNII